MNASSAPSGGLFGAPPAFGGGLGTQLFGAPSGPEGDLRPEKEDDDGEVAPPPESESESEPGDSDAESESEPSEKSILEIGRAHV